MNIKANNLSQRLSIIISIQMTVIRSSAGCGPSGVIASSVIAAPLVVARRPFIFARPAVVVARPAFIGGIGGGIIGRRGC